MRTDRDRQQELASTVQVRKARLLSLLGPAERRTVRRWGSTNPETFEDNAADVAERDSVRAQPVAEALGELQLAVEVMWLHLIETGHAGWLANTWRKSHRDYDWLAFEEVEAEAIFLLRYWILRFKPNAVNFATFAQRGIHQQLTEWACQHGPVQVPDKVARQTNATKLRSVEYEVAERSGQRGHVDLLTMALDGEITKEDL
jgi:hypothetical protein